MTDQKQRLADLLVDAQGALIELRADCPARTKT